MKEFINVFINTFKSFKKSKKILIYVLYILAILFLIAMLGMPSNYRISYLMTSVAISAIPTAIILFNTKYLKDVGYTKLNKISAAIVIVNIFIISSVLMPKEPPTTGTLQNVSSNASSSEVSSNITTSSETSSSEVSSNLEVSSIPETPSSIATSSSKVSYSSKPTTTSSKITTQATTPKPSSTTTTQNNTNAKMVWIDATAKKYHTKSDCSGMDNAWQVTVSEAIAAGRENCRKCAKHIKNN